jgi:hypothetical protein
LLTPALEQIGLLEWSAYDETVEAGYRSTMEALAAPPAPAPRPADIG